MTKEFKVYILTIFHANGHFIDDVVYAKKEDARKAWEEARNELLDCNSELVDDDVDEMYCRDQVDNEIFVREQDVW